MSIQSGFIKRANVLGLQKDAEGLLSRLNPKEILPWLALMQLSKKDKDSKDPEKEKKKYKGIKEL